MRSPGKSFGGSANAAVEKVRKRPMARRSPVVEVATIDANTLRTGAADGRFAVSIGGDELLASA
jgi:hypothetical protein